MSMGASGLWGRVAVVDGALLSTPTEGGAGPRVTSPSGAVTHPHPPCLGDNRAPPALGRRQGPQGEPGPAPLFLSGGVSQPPNQRALQGTDAGGTAWDRAGDSRDKGSYTKGRTGLTSGRALGPAPPQSSRGCLQWGVRSTGVMGQVLLGLGRGEGHHGGSGPHSPIPSVCSPCHRGVI